MARSHNQYGTTHISPPLRCGPRGHACGNHYTQTVVHNVFKDGAFTTPYSKEECSAYIEHLPETFAHEGRVIHKREFLDSWDEVVSYATRLLERAKERPPPETLKEKSRTPATPNLKSQGTRHCSEKLESQKTKDSSVNLTTSGYTPTPTT